MPRALAVTPRSWLALSVSVVLIAALSVAVAPPAFSFPPDVPSKSQVQSELNSLTVKSEGSMTGYSRDKFPHWITISGSCNTRETVLKRDGSNVVVNSDCYPTSGSWWSHYDGITEYAASDIDIDHTYSRLRQ